MIPGQRQIYVTGLGISLMLERQECYALCQYKFRKFRRRIYNIIGDHKGQSFYLDVDFFIGIFCFIQAYTKLEMAFSSTSYLDFLYTKESLIIVFFLEDEP